MKKFRKLFISILSLVIVFSLALSVGFACGGKETDDDEAFKGVHVFTATDTDKEFIKNGRTNYKLVLPMIENNNLAIARKEFTWLFNEATGINIPAIKDEGLVHNADQKYISLGNTALLQSAGIEIDSEALGDDGVRIVTKDGNIYICGGGDFGTIYGVYDFFEIAFNYIYVYIDAYSIDRNVKNMNLKNFDVTDIPDIGFRSGVGFERLYGDNQYFGVEDYRYYAGYRGRVPFNTEHLFAGNLRYVKNSQKKYDYGTIGAYNGRVLPSTSQVDKMHNDLDLLLPDVYKGEHPKWFSSGGDLCFTAQGDANEYKAMVDEVAFRFFEAIMGHRRGTGINRADEYDRFILPLTLEDGIQACPCDKCKELTEQYGQMSSTLILFINDVADKLFGPEGILEQERIKCENDPNYYFVFEPESTECKLRYEDYYKDSYVITFFAYGYVADPPCVQDENGDWVGVAPEIYLKDRIVPWLAYQQEPWEDWYSDNYYKQRFKNRIGGWAELCSQGFNYYEYITTFSNNTLNPDGTFQGMTPEYYNFLASEGCLNLFADSHWGTTYNTYPPAFGTLHLYLRRQMAWNSSIDYDTLIDNYFTIMFGDAKDTMYQLYLNQRDHAAHNWNCDDMYRSDTSKAEYWSYQVAVEWEEYINQARKDIEPLKETDPELYEIYSGHIDGEWLVPAQHILVYHKTKISADKFYEYKQQLEKIVNDWWMINAKCYRGTYAEFLSTLKQN